MQVRAGGQWRADIQPYVGVGGTHRTAESVWTRSGTEWVRAWSKIPAAVGTLSLTSNPAWNTITVGWSGVATAVAYSVYRNGTKVSTVTTPSVTWTGLARNTNYYITVRAVNTAGAEGPDSPARRYFTGRDAVVDSGTVGVGVGCGASSSWRGDIGWGSTGDDVRQGFFSTPYAGLGYRGVYDYGWGGVAAAIAATCGGGAIGNARLANGSAAAASMYMVKKGGVGSGGAVVVSIYASTATAGAGGQPALVTARHDVTSTASGDGKWYPLRPDMIAAHVAGSARSFCLAADTKAQYAAFVGRGSGAFSDGDLSITWTWNYVTQAALPHTWTSV